MTLKKGSREIRLFFLFLFIGLLADLTMYVFNQIGLGDKNKFVYNFYSLIEALFFIYLIKTYVKNVKAEGLANTLFIFTPIFWVSLQVLRWFFPIQQYYPGLVFDLYYEISFSFLAGIVLLEMVEKYDSVSDKPMFWIFLGIFFYCFCTFFIATFLNTELSKNLWFLHNVFNIITYGFYTVGLWKYYKTQKLNLIKKET
ncbi:hypothetical protein [Aquiflexum gelatinilyticum]|uniref:Uncharacterized protein n=1 Tax=Aquiflexum gelatinilyticum TaxID=2961943 RepID=A0A9X2SYR8_9BACT|nr:hypothetical protein [Aquiflexum gelatinilyticum]MCR9015514.1 hypothetical protein [Aquiflexum gelatinilyticum]